MNTFLQHH